MRCADSRRRHLADPAVQRFGTLTPAHERDQTMLDAGIAVAQLPDRDVRGFFGH